MFFRVGLHPDSSRILVNFLRPIASFHTKIFFRMNDNEWSKMTRRRAGETKMDFHRRRSKKIPLKMMVMCFVDTGIVMTIMMMIVSRL
jgi:hypothetical protein